MNETPEEAREEAARILDERRFDETELPRPLERPLEWIGDRLQELGELFDRVVPGSEALAWLVLGLLVLLAALALALRLVQRRAPGLERRRGDRNVRVGEVDAAALERDADAAERAGDLERAVRLRFRSGILRLAERRQLDDPASVTTGALVRRLRSDAFTDGARAFDEVVYGRRAATADDARRVREAWQAVLVR
jgi:Domain of unknown function (DUF4129)